MFGAHNLPAHYAWTVLFFLRSCCLSSKQKQNPFRKWGWTRDRHFFFRSRVISQYYLRSVEFRSGLSLKWCTFIHLVNTFIQSNYSAFKGHFLFVFPELSWCWKYWRWKIKVNTEVNSTGLSNCTMFHLWNNGSLVCLPVCI